MLSSVCATRFRSRNRSLPTFGSGNCAVSQPIPNVSPGLRPSRITRFQFVRVHSSSSLLISGASASTHQTINRSRKRTCCSSTPIGENGLISSERTSIYSIPPRRSASDGVSPLRVTRLGRIGAYSSFSICSTLLLICRRLPSFSRPISAYSVDGVLIARFNPATYSCKSLNVIPRLLCDLLV